MSIQPEEFLAQGPSAFLNQPGFLEQGILPDPKPKVEDHPDFAKIALGIAAAVVVLRLLMKAEFSKIEPHTQEEINAAAKRVYKRVFPAWLHVSVPAIAQAYRLGTTEAVSYSELERMATVYAEELGDYINDSSILALTDGFNSQVNAGWSERLAWVRAREAYGLDGQQMRSYVKGLMARDKADYATDPIPATSRAMVDRLFLFRADKLSQNEAFKASQVGRNLVWLSLQASGQIPEGTMKKWVTAEDERVCGVCGPLDQVTIPLHRRFKTIGGEYFYAPGVHPNCRCELEIVYPDLGIDVVKKDMPGDPFDRAENGRFATNEERKAKSMVAGKSMIARNMVARDMTEAHDLGSKDGARDMVAARDMVQGKDMVQGAKSMLGERREAVSLVEQARALRREQEHAIQREMVEAAEAEESARLAASTGSRAVAGTGDVHGDVAAARRGLDAAKHRQKTIGFTRFRRPDDFDFQASTLYVPASNYMLTRHMSNSQLVPGTEVQLGMTRAVQEGTNITYWSSANSEKVIGFHQEDELSDDDSARWITDPDDPYFELVGSDAFADAFDHYMQLPDGGSLIRSENRTAKPQDEKAAADISDYRRFGNEIDRRFSDARRALANMSRDELVTFMNKVVGSSEDARMYLTPDEDISENDTATDIAGAILSALEAETLENEKWRASHGSPRNDGAWSTEIYRLGQERGTHELTEADAIAQSEMLIADVSEGRRITPVFFQIPGWYGAIPSVPVGRPRKSVEGHVRGRYVVTSVHTVPLPADIADEVGESIDGVTIAKLKWMGSPDEVGEWRD